MNRYLKRISFSFVLSLLALFLSTYSSVTFAVEPTTETKTFYIQTDDASGQLDKNGKTLLKAQTKQGKDIITLKNDVNGRTASLAKDTLILLNFPGVDPTSEVVISPAKGIIERAPGTYHLPRGSIGLLKTVGEGTATVTIKAKKKAQKNSSYAAHTLDNWAGYVRSTGGPFTNVTSFWRVPSVTCGMGDTYMGAWVGIDGFNNNDLIQTGTDSRCVSGTASYHAWWEILPAASQPITGNSVSPGDTMYAQISKNVTNWTITIKNLTQNWSFSTTQTYSGAQNSVEWIVEPPTIGGNLSSLADYGEMSFLNDTQNTINPNHSYATDSIDMVLNNTVLSTPSTPSANLNAFSVAYGSLAPTPPASWSATGLTNYARYNSATAKLSSGKVYLTGGEGQNPSPNCYNFVDEYNPATNTWASKATMIQRRYYHTANVVTVSGGGERLLVVGGRGPNGYPGDYLKSAELYNPSTNSWSYTGTDMSTYHMNHTSTVLSNGKVLVVGGLGNSGVLTAAVDLYDPIANSWSVAATMSAARAGHTATLLNDGKVLVAGGGSSSATTSALLYDPSLNSWSVNSNMNTARSNPKAVLLNDGKVIVMGGQANDGSILSSAEIWSPSTNTWTTVAPMFYRRLNHSAILLPNGKVFVSGGNGGILGLSNIPQSSAEIYDPATDKWTLLPSMITPRNKQTAALLDSGKILMINGTTSSGPTDKAEYFTP